MVTLHEVITFLVSMQISISSLQTHNVNRCGRSRHLARKLSLRSEERFSRNAETEVVCRLLLEKKDGPLTARLSSVVWPMTTDSGFFSPWATPTSCWPKLASFPSWRNLSSFFFCNETPTTAIYTLSLHDALPIFSMQISISSLQTHNVNRCGRSRHLARKLSLRRKRSSPNVFEMAATETITSIILIKLIRVSLGTVRHPRRFKIVVIDIQITLKQMLRDFIGIRVNRAKKSGMVNITSSVNSRERSGINTILHELNPLFTINVTMRDIKSKNVYSRVNSKATTQWRKTESANGVHLEGVASDNRSS